MKVGREWKNGMLVTTYPTAEDMRSIVKEQTVKDLYQKIENTARRKNYYLVELKESVSKELQEQLKSDGFEIEDLSINEIRISWEK